MRPVVAGIIDVGSNTLRLLVAASAPGGLDTILSERAHVGLAADVERHGAISEARLRRVHEVAERYGVLARECGVDRLEVVVTAPGRQSANAAALHEQLADATGVPVRQLSAETKVPSPTRAQSVPAARCRGRSPSSTWAADRLRSWSGRRKDRRGSGRSSWALRLTERVVRADPPTGEELGPCRPGPSRPSRA